MNGHNMQARPIATENRLDVMNFLNEIAGRYPRAVPFSSGRPAEQFFELEKWMQSVPVFARHFAARHGCDMETAMNLLAQYGRTNGIINDLIAMQVLLDEAISCAPDDVIVTAGCQEAISLCVQVLCTAPDDVLLVRDPSYIGITGVAYLGGVSIVPVPGDTGGSITASLKAVVAAQIQGGKRPRALYLVPDFDNPTGQVLSVSEREEIIDQCASNGITILEDNPYGMFRFEGSDLPSMYSLDRRGCVIHLGTYSKTICPALRIGFAILPAAGGNSEISMEKLSEAKSFLTLNTSQLMQALTGAILLTQGCSLKAVTLVARDYYHANRDLMLSALSANFAGHESEVQWNTPEGGFFLVVTLPFPFMGKEAEICAREYDVLTMPLSFFALGNSHQHQVRLAFSAAKPSLIEAGIGRFAAYVKTRLAVAPAD